MKTEAEIGAMQLQAKKDQLPATTRSRKEARMDASLSSQKEHGSNTLISEFHPP